jgi:structural maintenance of chromosomes protein 6
LITVHLRNQGKDAYKPLIYGKTIIIERKIDKNSSSYKIKDEFGKVQEKTRTELQLILNQFNIQIDNPCTIMTQDISRKFLGSTNPKDKYSVWSYIF